MDYRQLDGTSTTAATDNPMTDQKQAPERITLMDLLEAAEKRELEMVRTAQSLTEAAHKFAERIKEAEAERDQALAASAAREIAMRDRAAEIARECDDECECMGCCYTSITLDAIRALPLSPDGQQALNEMLADAWDDGYFAVPGQDNPYRKATNEGEA